MFKILAASRKDSMHDAHGHEEDPDLCLTILVGIDVLDRRICIPISRGFDPAAGR